MVSQRWSVDSHKNKYVNGKPSGQIPVGYGIYLDNPTDYLLEEGDREFQITPRNSAGGTSAICSLTQDESGEQIDINIYTPDTKKDNSISVFLYKHPTNPYMAIVSLIAEFPVNSTINFTMTIQYGVSTGDTRKYDFYIYKDSIEGEYTIDVQQEANPRILDYGYAPGEDDMYIYKAQIM